MKRCLPQYVLGTPLTFSQVFIFEDTTVSRALEMFEQNSFSHPALIVSDEKRNFLGIITQKDLGRFLDGNVNDDCRSFAVRDIYNRHPMTITESELEEHCTLGTDPFAALPPSISFMPIIKDGRFVNMVFNQKFYEQHKWNIIVDLVDRCHLRCPVCPRGRMEMKHSSRVMSLELFGRVIRRAREMLGGISRWSLYEYSEPFLNHELYKYVELLAKEGFPKLEVSSNFSLAEIPNFDEFLASGFTALYVSVSGFTQKTYEKYHRNGNLAFVKKNLEYASKYKRSHGIPGNIWIRYLNFGYNADEVRMFEEYARKLGFLFENVKGGGYTREGEWGSWVSPAQGVELGSPEDITAMFLKEFHHASSNYRPMRSCSYSDTIWLNCEANVYLCCGVPNHNCFKIGNFLTDDVEDLLINRLFHPYCQICPIEKTHPLPDNVKAEIRKRLN